MGSYNVTCGLSGLTIEYGDPVVFMFLHEAKGAYRDGNFFNNPYWVRNIPIKGTYDSYGRIENWDESDPCVELLLRGLHADLVEMEQGENTIHDLPVKKGASLEDYLDAAHSERLMAHNVYQERFLPAAAEGIIDIEKMLSIDLHSFTDTYATNEDTSHPLRSCLVRRDVWDAYISVARKHEEDLGSVPATPGLHECSAPGRMYAVPLSPGSHLNMVETPSKELLESVREFVYVSKTMDALRQEFVPSLYAGQEVHYDVAAETAKKLAYIARKIQKDKRHG